MNDILLIICGATGDLVSKKIIPSLYELFLNKKLPKNFKVIAFARRDFNNGKYNQIIDDSLKKYLKIEINKSDIDGFYKLFVYHQGDFNNTESYENLGKVITEQEKSLNKTYTKFFYLAVPSDKYADVIKGLESSTLINSCKDDENANIIIEKPFGLNLESALKLDDLLYKLFTEKQIYRIDHYLGKDIIDYILNIRSNIILKSIWNNKFIKSIYIKLLEDFGVEDRGKFYDEVGALRDMGQNHLLELLAYLTLNETDLKEDNKIESARNDTLKKLKTMTKEEIEKNTFRAQYIGYKQIDEVEIQSTTETYFRLQTYLEDIKVILESGKRVGILQKEIQIMFENAELIFKFDQEHSITLKMNNLIDRQEKEIIFKQEIKQTKSQYTDEYAKLLSEAFQKKKQNFVSNDEVITMWNFIDPIEKIWKEGKPELIEYKPDDQSILEKANKKIKV